MGIEKMGGVIASLRKEKNITQEELAEHVGVSAQAVSKWENGGAPDSALLPDIADFLGVSVDALFGRSIVNYSGLHEAVSKHIVDTPYEKRLTLLDSLCGAMQTALFVDNDSMNPVTEYRKSGENAYSEYHGEDGYTLVGLNGDLPYFMVLPKTPAFDDFGVSEDDFCAFFAALSDPVVFHALVLITKNNAKKFTAKHLMVDLNITEEKAAEVLQILMKYHYLFSEEIEIDDIVHTVYYCPPTVPAVTAPLLLMAHRMIKGNYYFRGFSGNSAPCLK